MSAGVRLVAVGAALSQAIIGSVVSILVRTLQGLSHSGCLFLFHAVPICQIGLHARSLFLALGQAWTRW